MTVVKLQIVIVLAIFFKSKRNLCVRPSVILSFCNVYLFVAKKIKTYYKKKCLRLVLCIGPVMITKN